MTVRRFTLALTTLIAMTSKAFAGPLLLAPLIAAASAVGVTGAAATIGASILVGAVTISTSRNLLVIERRS